VGYNVSCITIIDTIILTNYTNNAYISHIGYRTPLRGVMVTVRRSMLLEDGMEAFSGGNIKVHYIDIYVYICIYICIYIYRYIDNVYIYIYIYNAPTP
jgi:hypothetical protein